jgi:hypothetical protein
MPQDHSAAEAVSSTGSATDMWAATATATLAELAVATAKNEAAKVTAADRMDLVSTD